MRQSDLLIILQSLVENPYKHNHKVLGSQMEGAENILEVFYEEESLEDVDMLDAEPVEEGEIKEETQQNELMEGGGKDVRITDQGPHNKNNRRCKKKKKRKTKKNSTGPDRSITDINRFVIDTCKRLKERKSYLVWNAVGCLGVSAVSDLVKEVEAIQACGGQMTADGKRARFGGGILWNILKTREPKAFKEIMAKGKELEKQFWNQKKTQKSQDAVSSERTPCRPSDQIVDQGAEGFQSTSERQEEPGMTDACGNRRSALSRIRVPVAYDDLFGENGKTE